MAPTYKRGDKVKVIKGSYKGKEGVFLRLAGEQSAAIAIKGDSQQERTLRRTSIKLKEVKAPTKAELIQEVREITSRLEELRLMLLELD